jgi:hypothetical protein
LGVIFAFLDLGPDFESGSTAPETMTITLICRCTRVRYLAGKVSDVGVNFEMNVIRGDLVECLSTLLTAPKIRK